MQLFKDTNYNFLAIKRQAIMVSLVVIGIGIISMIFHGGPRYGIDFTGGAAMTFAFQEPVGADEVRNALSQAGMQSYEVTHFGDKQHVLVRLQLAETAGAGLDYLGAITSQFQQAFPNNQFVVDQNDLVGPKIGTELREKALLALLFSMIGVIIYISIRFEAESFMGVMLTTVFGLIVLSVSTTELVLSSDLLTVLLMLIASAVVTYICMRFDFKFAVGAIVAIIHDVLVTVGVLSLLDIEFNLTIVAALLTIVGYSLNDTIVIFDRIREEYPKERKRLSLEQVVNFSINATLSRTIMTTFTTLLVVVVLLFFGGEVIRPFALALTVGMIAGVYSTIYIASPVMMWWNERFGQGKEITARRATATT